MADHLSEGNGIRIVRMPGPASPALVEFTADHSGRSADITRTYAYRQVTGSSYYSVWFVVDLSETGGSGYLLEWRSKRGYGCSCAGFRTRRTCRHVAGIRTIVASVRDDASAVPAPETGEEKREENSPETPGIF